MGGVAGGVNISSAPINARCAASQRAVLLALSSSTGKKALRAVVLSEEPLLLFCDDASLPFLLLGGLGRETRGGSAIESIFFLPQTPCTRRTLAESGTSTRGRKE